MFFSKLRIKRNVLFAIETNISKLIKEHRDFFVHLSVCEIQGMIE